MHTIHIPARTVNVYEFDELPPDTQREIADDYAYSTEWCQDLSLETQEIFDAINRFESLFRGLRFEWDSWDNCRVREYPEVDADTLPVLSDSWACNWAEYTVQDAYNAHYGRLKYLADQLYRWEDISSHSDETGYNWHSYARAEHYYLSLTSEVKATMDDIARACANDYDAQVEYMRTVDWFAERARALELCFTADGDQYIGGDAA